MDNILALAKLALNGASLVASLIEKGSELVGPANSTLVKSLTVVKTMIETGKEIAPIATALIGIFTEGRKDITLKELEELEAVLDAEIDDYLTPMKPRTA